MKKKILNELKNIRPLNLLMLFVAGVINACAATLFIMPVNLYDSGISGTSMFLTELTGGKIGLSLFLVVLNIPLFIYGFKKQGLLFTIYSVFTVSVYSLSAWFITDVLPVDVSVASPIAQEDLLLCAIFGGVISGVGSGLAIRYGGSMDGIEVMAVIFAKKLSITVGTFVMIYNAALYIISAAVTGEWILSLYSVITYFAALKTIDFIVEGLDRSKCAMIITSKSEEICTVLCDTFESGATVTNCKGGYSGKEKSIVYFVLNRFQVAKLKDVVHTIDPKAYITISEVADVFSANNEK